MQKLILSPWSLRAEGFCKEQQGQLEALFSQGNGTLGMRYASEIPCHGRQRDCFVAGVYDAAPGEVGELVNFPDPLGLRVFLDGEELTMEACGVYEAELNLRYGRARRSYRLTARNGKSLTVSAERVIPLNRPRVVAERMIFTPDAPCMLQWQAVIDGNTTNGGTQHWVDGEHRCVPSSGWAMECHTQQSGVAACITVAAKTNAQRSRIFRQRRIVGALFESEGEKPTVLNRYAAVAVCREGMLPAQEAEAEAQAAATAGFDTICAENDTAWTDYWGDADVRLESDEPADQTAIRFALYHLRVMTPQADADVSIAAKGLSGEAYKGHVFWDTEMFLLPAWLVIDSETAKRLLRYRYACLPAAKRRAEAGGYRGAQFPWESAQPEAGDVTPATVEGWVDTATGRAVPILEKTDEIHITADVAYAVWQVWQGTHDEAFMADYGDELLRETARFWASRAQWNEVKQCYDILDVIGPDEYSEHSDNNAYTNWMAHGNLCAALDRKLFSPNEEAQIRNVAEGLALPRANADRVIPQADGWLIQKQLDVSVLRELPESALADMDIGQVTHSQVLKQADVVALLTTLPEAFSPEVRAASFDYYEARCLHFSSLSYPAHCLALTRMGQAERAYDFFRRVRGLDLQEGTASSEGIHAAALGGIWQCIVQGFLGLKWQNGTYILSPALPAAWQRVTLSLPIASGRRLVTVTPEGITVEGKETFK